MALIHAHCSSCVSARCERSHWQSADGCPVEVCPNGCGTYLHNCKQDEHTRHTCWAALVPCLNATNGCEEVLPRAKLAQHLLHCPAYILVCRFEERETVTSYEMPYWPCGVVYRRDEFPVNCKDYYFRQQTDTQHVEYCPKLAHGYKLHSEVQQTQDSNSSAMKFEKGVDSVGKTPSVHQVKEVQDSSQTKQHKVELCGSGHEDEGGDVLGQLPVEILMKICQHLDSLALWNLSQVNHYIRSVCFNLVKQKGIMYYVWHKKGHSKWVQGPKCWSFSKVFSGRSLWSYSTTRRKDGRPITMLGQMSHSHIRSI